MRPRSPRGRRAPRRSARPTRAISGRRSTVAAELPLAIADAAAATAELAALAAEWAIGYEKADAIAAAALAEGATRAAAALVHANLTTVPGDARAAAAGRARRRRQPRARRRRWRRR